MDEQERVTKEVGDSGTVTRREVVRDTSTISPAIMAQRVVYFIFGLIISLLAIRMLLLLLAANQSNAFVAFIYQLSSVFAAPFYGIFGYEPQYGSFVFEISTLVAIAVYALLGWGLASLFTIGSSKREVV